MKSIRTKTFAFLTFSMGLFAAGGASAETKLRVATLAPKASSWGKVLRVWEQATEKKSNGQLKLEIYYNGVQGREKAMIAKMKTGQLDGAVVSTEGLSIINFDINALSISGLITTWPTMEKVRNAMIGDFKAKFEKEGYMFLGWQDAGLMRSFSRGVVAKKPTDLTGKRVVVFSDDAMGSIGNSLIPGVVSVPLDPFETLPQISQGNVNFVTVPAIAAEQLQWTPHLENAYDRVSGCAVGGTLFRKQPLDALPADVREGFIGLQKGLESYHTTRNRQEDDASWGRVSKKLQVVNMDMAAWDEHDMKAARKISQGLLPKALVEKVAKLAGKTL